jgi:hypothetical protein
VACTAQSLLTRASFFCPSFLPSCFPSFLPSSLPSFPVPSLGPLLPHSNLPGLSRPPASFVCTRLFACLHRACTRAHTRVLPSSLPSFPSLPFLESSLSSLQICQFVTPSCLFCSRALVHARARVHHACTRVVVPSLRSSSPLRGSFPRCLPPLASFLHSSPSFHCLHSFLSFFSIGRVCACFALPVSQRTKGAQNKRPATVGTFVVACTSATSIQVRPPGCFTRVSMITPIVSALKNYCR